MSFTAAGRTHWPCLSNQQHLSLLFTKLLHKSGCGIICEARLFSAQPSSLHSSRMERQVIQKKGLQMKGWSQTSTSQTLLFTAAQTLHLHWSAAAGVNAPPRSSGGCIWALRCFPCKNLVFIYSFRSILLYLVIFYWDCVSWYWYFLLIWTD